MKMREKIWNIFGILFGLGAIVIGVLFLTNWGISYGHGGLTEYTFGGDFYTHIYNAVRSIYGSLWYLVDLIEFVNKGFGFAFILLGLFRIVRDGKELSSSRKKEQPSKPSGSMVQEIDNAYNTNTQKVGVPSEYHVDSIRSREINSKIEPDYTKF